MEMLNEDNVMLELRIVELDMSSWDEYVDFELFVIKMNTCYLPVNLNALKKISNLFHVNTCK